jgi:hypothetical protein
MDWANDPVTQQALLAAVIGITLGGGTVMLLRLALSNLLWLVPLGAWLAIGFTVAVRLLSAPVP